MIYYYFYVLSMILLFSGCQTYTILFSEGEAEDEIISKSNIQTNLEYLASDELEGRETGTRGAKLAASYISKQLKNYGVKPYKKNGYFQEFRLKSISIDKKSSMSIDTINEDILQEFEYNTDFVGYTKYAIPIDTTVQLVFAGYGIKAVEYDYDDYDSLDANGKIVLIYHGEPPSEDSSYFEGSKDTPYATTLNKIMTAKEQGALAVFMTSKMEKEQGWQKITEYMDKKVLKLPDLESNGGGTKFPVFILNENTMEEILQLGYYSSSKLQTYIENGEKLPKFVFKNAIHICLKLNIKNDVTARNVIAKIDGIDQYLKHEYVVLSAHYDHVGVSEAGVYNGADDNGSGTVAILEVAKTLAQSRQNKRTIILAFHTGEEKGLLGSKYLTENIEILEDVIACINLDMVGRGVADSIYAIGSDKISTKFHELVETVNSTSTNLHISYKLNSDDEPRRLYYRSDHYSYAKKGIPTVFFFDNDMEDYHKISDDADKINYEKLTQVAELTYRLVLRLANVERRFEMEELGSK